MKKKRADGLSRYSAAVPWLFLIFVGMYFFDLATFPFSIDEEQSALRTDPSIWISQGRWGAYIIELLILPQPAIPVVPLALFGLSSAISYCLILDVLGRNGTLRAFDYLTFSIFCAYPVWFFIAEFYTNIGSIGVGMLASAGTVWLFLRQDKMLPISHRTLAGVALGAFAVGIYQGFVAVLTVLLCGGLLLQTTLGVVSRPWPRAFALAALWVLILVLYMALDLAFRLLPHPSNSYFESLWKPGLLVTDTMAVLVEIWHLALSVYGGSMNLGFALWASPVVLALGLASAIWGRLSLDMPSASFIIVSLFALLILPFAPALVSGGSAPIRSLIAVPAVIWVFAMLSSNSSSSTLQGASIVAVVTLVWQTFVFENRYQAVEYFSSRRDLQIAGSLGEKVLSLPSFDPRKTYYLVVYGSYNFPSKDSLEKSTTIGGSFFGWDGGNPGRMSAFLGLLGYPIFKYPMPEFEARYLPLISKMPVFPKPGSVALVDDAILLRLSEEPNFQDLSVLEDLQ